MIRGMTMNETRDWLIKTYSPDYGLLTPFVQGGMITHCQDIGISEFESQVRRWGGIIRFASEIVADHYNEGIVQ